MGGRPSRQRPPAEPSLALDALPPELLVQVLSHVPPRALVTRCRPVCRAWRDVVDGPTVWLLQLARDCSAQGRALYALAQRCPPNSEDQEELPLCALARYCLRAPLGRNLIFNSCGEQGFRGWEVEHGGNGWAVEKNLTLVPGAPSQTCFVTSFEWCFKRQLVDLVMEGIWQELLDSAQIEICVADWWGARENCGCVYRLRVRLLDEYENEVVKFSASPNPVLQWTERGCRQVSHVFTDFGKGIRYVSFEQYGRDTRSWVGHYGALVTHSSVKVAETKPRSHTKPGYKQPHRYADTCLQSPVRSHSLRQNPVSLLGTCVREAPGHPRLVPQTEGAKSKASHRAGPTGSARCPRET